MCKVTIKCPVDLGRKLTLARGRRWGLTQQTCMGQARGATSPSVRGPRGYHRCLGLGCTGGQRRVGLHGAATVLLWVQATDRTPPWGGLLTSWQRKGNARPRSHSSCRWAVARPHQVTSEYTTAPGQTARSHFCLSPSHLAFKWDLWFIFYKIAGQASGRP